MDELPVDILADTLAGLAAAPPLPAVADSSALIAADTLVLSLDSVPRWYIDAYQERLLAETDTVEVAAPPAWEEGLDGSPRHVNAGDNSGVLTVVALIILTMMLGYRSCRRLFTTLFQELWGMRHRANVFDEHTANETRLMVLMGVQWSVYTGLLLYSFIGLRHAMEPSHAFADVMRLMGLTAAYYLFQLCAYWVLGYTFSTDDGRRLFVRGFTASQSLLGFYLMLPALVAIFYPDGAAVMTAIGAGFYLVARIIFISKGFRIFYNKIYSLLYFILYLCTLEIVPIIYIYKIASKIG